jgi:hypothetical protein
MLLLISMVFGRFGIKMVVSIMVGIVIRVLGQIMVLLLKFSLVLQPLKIKVVIKRLLLMVEVNSWEI